MAIIAALLVTCRAPSRHSPGTSPPRPPIDAMLMILPPPLGIMVLATIADSWKAPKRLRLKHLEELVHREIERIGNPADAGVVDQDVDTAKFADGRVDQGLAVFDLAGVAGDRDGPHTLLFQFGTQGRDAAVDLARGDHDIGSGFGQGLGPSGRPRPTEPPVMTAFLPFRYRISSFTCIDKASSKLLIPAFCSLFLKRSSMTRGVMVGRS